LKLHDLLKRAVWTKPPWGAIWLLIGIIVVWHCWFSSYNHDEIEHLHASWLISSGELPFRDFLEQHHPTLWFFAAPIVGRFESVQHLIFAARVFDALCLVGVLWLVKHLLRRLYPEVPWQFSTLLLLSSFMFVRSTLEFRPDALMNVALFAGFLHWVVFLQGGRFWRAILSGVFFGCAVAVLQKAIVVLGLVGMSSLFLVGTRLWRREPVKRLLLGGATLFAAAAIPPSALFLAMRSLGIFNEFWFWNYPFNRFFYLEAHLPQHFSAVKAIGLSILVAPILWIAAAIGGRLCVRDLIFQGRLSARDECRLTVLWVAAGYLGLLCLNRFPLDQYFIVLLPLLAVLAAEAFHSSRERPQLVLFQRATLCMPVVLVAILLSYPPNREQRSVHAFVLGRTTGDQSIFVPPAFNPIFRRDAAYFWYNADMIRGAYEDSCRETQDCPDDKLRLDLNRWEDSPPIFVLLESPSSFPYHWSSRESFYRPTEIPRLWERAKTAQTAPSAKVGE
jgi:hypothetical protein